MAGKLKTQQKKDSSKLQGFFLIFIPLVFAITITAIVLTIAGIDVVGSAKKYANYIPGVASHVTTEAEGKTIQEEEQEKTAELISEKDSEIERIRAEGQEKDQLIEELNLEIEQLNKKLEELNNREETDQKQETLVKEISASFKEMEPAAAAQIMTNLEQSTALLVLADLPDKSRGTILGEMDPVEAARLTNAYLGKEE